MGHLDVIVLQVGQVSIAITMIMNVRTTHVEMEYVDIPWVDSIAHAIKDSMASHVE